jgi:hypothetical protein
MLMEIGMLLQADIPDPERQYQWLTTEIPAFGQKPIDMLGDDGGVAKLQGFLMVMGAGRHVLGEGRWRKRIGIVVASVSTSASVLGSTLMVTRSTGERNATRMSRYQ